MALDANYRTIALNVKGRKTEGVAGTATTYPGMMVQLQADGKYDPHVAQGALGEVAVALEDGLQDGNVNTAYAADDQLFFCIPLPGDEVALRLADEEDITVGDLIIHDTGGLFIKTTGTPAQTAFIALETLDLTGNGSDELIRCRRL
jgi:hypothetical protein